MAKGKIDMSKLSLGTAKPLKKKPATVVQKEAEVDDVAVKMIHDKKEKKPTPPPPPSKEPIVRITVDVYKSMHRAIKLRAMDNDVTIREYIIRLVQKDLKK